MNAPDKLPSSPEPHVMKTYGRLPVALSHGRGCWLWDTEGRKYLDGLAGIAVNTLGHDHPKLVPALRDQVGKLIHSSNYYLVPLQETLAARLCELSGLTNVFFCNSGLEANEAALKIARKYGHDKGIDLPQIIVYDNAFHGRSLATLSATGNVKVQKGFGPLVEGFVRVPMNDLAAIEHVAAEHPNVVAVFIEAIQGEGGITAASIEYLRALRERCDRNGWLLMIDEVQCGMGRTGKWFAHQWADIVPDVMPLAKGLASGVPIGAVVARGVAANVLGPGNHGTTFGGNPLATRAALETLSVIKDDKLLDNATEVGNLLASIIKTRLRDVTGFVEMRGRGLMLGVVLDRPCTDLPLKALSYKEDYGLLINVTNERVIRLLPSLIMSRDEAELLGNGVADLATDFLKV
jgi:acetylornithine/N-succinyldiaminopimelate aminotransferase